MNGARQVLSGFLGSALAEDVTAAAGGTARGEEARGARRSPGGTEQQAGRDGRVWPSALTDGTRDVQWEDAGSTSLTNEWRAA